MNAPCSGLVSQGSTVSMPPQGFTVTASKPQTSNMGSGVGGGAGVDVAALAVADDDGVGSRITDVLGGFLQGLEAGQTQGLVEG